MANGGIMQVDLVGPSRGPVVTPQATQQLSEAFRSGFITADDIVQRMSERTRAKQELELVTAKQGLEMAPLVQQAKTAELKAAIFDAQAKPGGFNLMQDALSKAGFPVNIDPNAGLTDANKTEIVNRFSALQQYVTKRAEAEERVKSTETKFFPTEQKLPSGATTKGQLQKLFHQGQEITSDQFKNWSQEAEALRRTPFSQWYALQTTKPGQVVAPAAPAAAPAPTLVISPIEAAQQRAQLANAGVSNAASLTDQQVASMIQPRVAPAAPVVTPQIGQTAPGIGIVTSIEAAPPPKAPTEVAGRSGSFAGRMTGAENQLAAVVASGFDPTTASVAAQQIGLFPEGFKSDDVKRFENAKLQWVTALLRRESGAAVPKWELDLYDRAFFPQWGDSPDIIAQKAQVRQQTAQSLLNESVGQPTFVTPAPVVAPGAAAPTIPTGATKNTTVVNGQTYRMRIDPATGQKKYFIVQ